MRGVAAVTLLLALALAPATDGKAATAALLAFIRALEAPGGYDDHERRIRLPPPRRLTEMTVGEVLDWQARVRATGAPSTAAGGYQIIRPTLLRLVEAGVVDPSMPFDPAVQDRLARFLIAGCGAPGPRWRHPRYGNCLARIWAALPLTHGPHRGRSAHHGTAGNRALTTPAAVLAVLAGTPAPAAPPPPDSGATALPDLREIGAAMAAASRTGGLSPPVRVWSVDPYAVR